MCIGLLGGMDRLKGKYMKVAGDYGVSLRHFKKSCPQLEKRLSGMDAIVIFTNMISHDAKKRALTTAKALGIPTRMCHSCGISSLNKCLGEIIREN